MKHSLLTKTVFLLSGVIFLLFILLSCRSSDKKTFAKTLARDIVSTTDRPDVNGKTQFNAMESSEYRDDNLKLEIKLNGVDLMAIGLKNAWQELMTGKKGDTGFVQDGLINFNGYETGFGRLEGQSLTLNRAPKGEKDAEVLMYTVKGTIKENDQDSVEVNYKFRIKNVTGQHFDLNTIEMISGQVKEGTEVYPVLP